MSQEELAAYRLEQLETRMKAMEDLMLTYQRRIMWAVIGGGALANSPTLAQMARAFLGAP